MSLLAKVLLALFGVPCALWVAVYEWARMPAFLPLPQGQRAQLLRALRAATDGEPTELPALPAPMVVSLYDLGVPVLRATLRSAEGFGAWREQALALTPAVRRRARIKVDLVQATAPIASRIEGWFALSVEPGVDGIGFEFDGREVLLTADDLLRAGLSAARPLPPTEIEAGLDTAALLGRLAAEVHADAGAWRKARRRLYRFRGDSFLERPFDSPVNRDQDPLVALRGHLVRDPRPSLRPERLRAAATAGGHYLLGQLDAAGRFAYEYFPLVDQPQLAGYSLPRHAGAAWYLAELYGVTRDPAFAEGAERALGFLRLQAPPGCRSELACVGEPGDQTVDLGSAAMSLIAISEYAHTTGRHGLDAWARRLASFLRFMQKANGDFAHLYHPRAGFRDERSKLLYFSGEAAFALAKWAQLTGASEDDARLQRALDWLTSGEYATFAGQFFYGEDHWTCLAADAAWARLDGDARLRYARFCDGFAAFLRRGQFAAGEAVTRAHPDYLGAYGFSPIAPPHTTPVGSRTEAMVATYAMDLRLGRPVEATRAQILAGLGFLLARQIDDDSAWLMASPARARGGFLMSDVEPKVRIDFVQHSGAALLRAAALASVAAGGLEDRP